MIIDDLATLTQIADDLKASGRSIVFTNGVFDILHAGHVTYLEQARALGDVLIVGVNTDASVHRRPERLTLCGPYHRLRRRHAHQRDPCTAAYGLGERGRLYA
jgi:cytidyltransferase-like protein